MRNTTFRILVFLLLSIAIVPSLDAQERKDNSAKIDSSETKDKKKSKFKSFSDIVTMDAESDIGLFTVHQVDEDFYYEIPFDLYNRDMLLVSRIAKMPEGLGGGSGRKSNEQIVRWSRVHDKILLKSISFSNVANDSLPINISVRNNNYEPIIAAFEIKGFNEDSTGALININKLFLTDVKAITGLTERTRSRYKVKSLDKSRSFIDKIRAYPENVEVKHDMTFTASNPPSNSRTGTISIQMSQSMYLLPEKPMMPRAYDHRVGWFTVGQIDYGSDALKSDEKTFIRRWKLIPKDIEAYNRGELVEPVKPIVYYLDPATPKKWRPYFRQGIEDWQVAFEAAGFKNAIIAKDPPSLEEDPDWSAEDARYSTVRYVANTTRNAMGPSVSDPRSGEIIESDIVWYHNHLRSYRNRYLLETGAANPSARTLNTPDEEIGEMMRMVISHEIGHAIGLPHNMKASYAYPTDSLRSAKFTQKWGLASTLMDYTRYNYVAQPGDEGVRWVRMLGPYDSYAVNWGYRYLYEAKSSEEEKETLDAWILEKEGDPMYLFGASNSFDPSSQTECVGDDPVKSSTYGLSNLKIVADSLFEWTSTDGQSYDDVEELYGELLSVWSRYSGHVIGNIGGVYELRRTVDQEGTSYTHLDAKEQRSSMDFLVENVFSTPTWLLQDDILRNIRPSGSTDRIRSLQSRSLSRLLTMSRLNRMIDNEALNGDEAYTLVEMMSSLKDAIFSELDSDSKIDPYRRNLQRAYISRLHLLMKEDAEKRTDISAVCFAQLTSLYADFESASARRTDGIDKFHLLDLRNQVDEILDVD